MVFEKDG